jgi:hypothetical protein
MTAVPESVEEFRERARGWLAANMPLIEPGQPPLRDRIDLRQFDVRITANRRWRRGRVVAPEEYDGIEYGGLPVDYRIFSNPLCCNVFYVRSRFSWHFSRQS